MAAIGMLQWITASGLVIPIPATAPAEPAVRTTPTVTQRRRRGGGASLMRHS